MRNLLSINSLNTAVIEKYNKVNLCSLFLPLFFLCTILLFLYSKNALFAERYVQIQVDYFLYSNSKLAQFPHLIYNVTQLGDAVIFLSFLSLLLIYAAKIWESLLTTLVVSTFFTLVLKTFFKVPRPTRILDDSTFIVIGPKLDGLNSLPSGHSVTAFAILTVLLFAFMPRKLSAKILWCISLITIGLVVISSRVGVGAHFPLDVIIGAIFGYISGLMGILISKKYKICAWINDQKFYPLLLLLIAVCGIVVCIKIYQENLIIYYLSLLSLIFSLYKITYVYVKK